MTFLESHSLYIDNAAREAISEVCRRKGVAVRAHLPGASPRLITFGAHWTLPRGINPSAPAAAGVQPEHRATVKEEAAQYISLPEAARKAWMRRLVEERFLAAEDPTNTTSHLRTTLLVGDQAVPDRGVFAVQVGGCRLWLPLALQDGPDVSLLPVGPCARQRCWHVLRRVVPLGRL